MNENPYDYDTTSEDSGYFLEVEFLKNEIKELIKNEVKPGDGDQSSKARRVLEIGTKHIMEGRPSKAFLQFVAESITRTLNHDEPTLDRAFRLVGPPHRLQSDPYAEDGVKKYLEIIYQELACIDAHPLESTARTKQVNTAKRKALDEAYAAEYKGTPQAHAANGIDPETIRKRIKRIREKLGKLGHY